MPLRGARLIEDLDGGDPQAVLDRDRDLAEKLRRGETVPVIRLWRNDTCLVVPQRDASRPGFAAAARQSAARGWPVILRQTGGTAVPHGPGILLLSQIYAAPAGWGIDDGYRLLCRPLETLVRDLGLEPVLTEVPGAFCDGRFNLAVDGRKIAGTAQRWLSAPGGRRIVLAHALLLLDADLVAAHGALNEYQRSVSLAVSDLTRVVGVFDLLGSPPSHKELLDRFRIVLRQSHIDGPTVPS